MSWRVSPSRSVVVDESAGNRMWKVIGVPDGDTFLVAGGPHRKHKEWCRMLCIDTPEKGQTGFEGARDRLRELIYNQYVSLEPERKWKWCRDKYGRTLVYVIKEGVLINGVMVNEGWSDYLTAFGRGRYQAVFQRCVASAVEARRGVWAEYRSNENWRWGRGRARPHFRNAKELANCRAQRFKKGGLEDGQVLTYSRTDPRRNSGHCLFQEQGRAIREAEGRAD